MSKIPLVSVCLAVYNAEKYLVQAVESILNQSFTDFEFLILDDGSSDLSPEIVNFYAKQDQRIWFKHRENCGISKTRNEMLRRAMGEFIAVMDADDVALPNRLADQVEFLQKHSDVVAVGGASNLIDEKGRFLTCLQYQEDDWIIQEKALAGHGTICHPSAMIRREKLLEVGGYDETFFPSAHDLDLWLKLGETGKLSNLKKPIISYRLHSTSISEVSGMAQRDEANLACQNAWQRRGIKGHFEATEPWRPTRDRASRYQFALKYGWWAWNSGQRITALIYGWKALRVMLWKKEGLILVLCALLKPLPTAKQTIS